MNYFLLLIILALCAGGYYEYTTIQDLDSANKEKFTDLNTKIDALQSANKKLEDDEKQLADKVGGGTQGGVASTGGQASTPVQTSPTIAPSSPATLAAARNSNDLGTIITSQKTYQECHLLNVKANCIVVKYIDGPSQPITEIKYADLRGELQKRFGYDPQLNTNLTPDQIQVAEQQRQAAGN